MGRAFPCLAARRLKTLVHKVLIPLLLASALTAHAAGTVIGDFSAMQPGAAVPAGWDLVTLPNITPTRFELVEDGGATVVQVSAAGSAASLARAIPQPAAASSVISWRWRVDRVVAQGDL